MPLFTKLQYVFITKDNYTIHLSLVKKEDSLRSSSVVTLYALLRGPGPIVTAEMTKL